MYRITLTSVYIVSCVTLFSQSPSYFGGGGDSSVTVTSSPVFHDQYWPDSANAYHTINGQGMLAPYFDATRFLTQASLGFEHSDVQSVMSLGYQGWIDDQLTKPAELMLPKTESIFDILADSLTAAGMSEEIPRRPTWRHFNYAWWEVNTLNEDLLRHKVAAALSEILVISRLSDLGEYGDGMAGYYDLLLQHAFGNYRDLLYDVTLHTCMGFYLSHLNNPKTIDSIGQHPDENYARELMQLLTIGLYELNLDGSRKTSGGEEIPTYDNADIAEFAKVLTGLGVGDVIPELLDPNDMYDDTAYFGMGLWKANVVVPMRMYEYDDPNTSWRDEDQHEDGQKSLLNGFIVPDGQLGLQDINDALDNLFNHDNVGPFIGYRLIQRLVKSNPSPAYVTRVAEAFNGTGPYGTVRGDMKSVVKAILLDEEAREVSYQLSDVNSKLKEPLFRYTQFSRAVEKFNPNGFYWNIGYSFFEDTKQAILASPSVFNFFLPDDSPNGEINDMGLVAPEFKIHDSRTSVGYMNNAYRWTQSWGEIMGTWEGDIMNNTEVTWVVDDLLNIVHDSETYINWLDQHLLGGQMTDKTRGIIRKALNSFDPNIEWHDYQENRVRVGMYLALISPEYSVMR
ncbi:MAG: DUF1800 domain-containing protein [Saprospiraceae bacterium]|nr:DUF1800 domain-containing protein [Saprospiraceae bacterium]